jgi:hypothetical protein
MELVMFHVLLLPGACKRACANASGWTGALCNSNCSSSKNRPHQRQHDHFLHQLASTAKDQQGMFESRLLQYYVVSSTTRCCCSTLETKQSKALAPTSNA